MLKRNYSKTLATGTVAASGTLGQIIPPSIVLVLLGDVMNVPIGDLFVGAVIPGILLVSLYIAYIATIARIKPEWAPTIPAEELANISKTEMRKKILTSLIPPLFLICSVLGTIFAGIASPTEAAALGAVGASLLTMAKGRFNLETAMEVMTSTTKLTCMVFIILIGATTLGLVFRGLGGDTQIRELITGLTFGKWGILAIFMGVIFIAGFFLDFFEIVFIFVPILTPIMVSIGIEPLWLAVLIAVNGLKMFQFGITLLRDLIPFVILFLKS